MLFSSYDIHQKKLMKLREEAEGFKIYGIKGNEKYEELKSNMLHNKIKTHEYQENSKCILYLLFNWQKK
jgi:hypothetical protein